MKTKTKLNKVKIEFLFTKQFDLSADNLREIFIKDVVTAFFFRTRTGSGY